MKLIVTSLVLLATTVQCQGGLSLLGGLLSSAHNRVHDVAGAVLGTINKGLNFNFDGQFGINGQRQPSHGYQHQEQQNEYESYYTYGQGSYGYRPNQNGVQQPVNNNQRPHVPNNNGYNRPTYNGDNNFNEQYGNEHSMYPNNNYQNSYQNNPNNNNYGYYDQQRPNNPSNVYGNGYNYNQNQGYNYNQGYPNNLNGQNNNGYNNQNSGYDSENNVYDNQNNEYNNNNSGYNNNNGYNDQNNINKPTFEKPVNSGHGTTQGQKEPVQHTTSSHRLTPPTTTQTTPITNANDEEDENDNQNPNKDAPIFIPLGQNEYVYGGDTINMAPKRETDNKPQKAEEEEFPIDIRFGD